MKRVILFCCASFLLPCTALAQKKPHVLVISIDGMRPDYVTAATEHGLKVPTLRSFMVDGAYADGVQGVVPTMTYPSHTTIVTGVGPEVHGVHNNQKFDPMGELNGAVYTDASMIKVPTLWHAAKAAGYTTASVGWPVTTGAKDIDYLMPANASFEGGSSDGEQVVAADVNAHLDYPAGLRETLASDLPPGESSIDDKRFGWTLAILRRYKPEFMTTHLIDLDHIEHATGPFSPESNRTIEAIDVRIAQMVKLERSIDPNAYIMIVSDHGFLSVTKRINLGVLLTDAGLIRLSSEDQGRKGGVTSWDAQVWPAGGTAAVVLRDPTDTTIRDKVKRLLDTAAANPEYGISHILTHTDLATFGGGFPEASFVVEFKPGFAAGAARRGKVINPTGGTGAHGYLPNRPELRASFFLEGPDVSSGRDLGVVNMQQIAPTIAAILHVSLPDAKALPIKYGK